MIDLHLHLDGSLDPRDMETLAELSGVALPVHSRSELQALLTVEPDCTNLGEYLQKFDLPLQVLQTTAALKWAVYRLIGRLAAQGLCYAEIRFAPQFHQQKGLNQAQVVQAAVTGLQRGVREFGMPAQLILCCMRFENNQNENLETLRLAKQYLGRGVCALDLAGNEAAYPTQNYEDLFREARQQGVPLVIHAGEAAGPESVWEALRQGAVRIGHGLHAAEDEGLVQELSRCKVPLEMCLTSNLQTKGIPEAAQFPLRTFRDAGVTVTVNTDNMTVSGTDLRREYLQVQNLYQFSAQEMEQLALTAADSTFLPPAEQAALKARIRRDFGRWLAGGMIQP